MDCKKENSIFLPQWCKSLGLQDRVTLETNQFVRVFGPQKGLELFQMVTLERSEKLDIIKRSTTWFICMKEVTGIVVWKKKKTVTEKLYLLYSIICPTSTCQTWTNAAWSQHACCFVSESYKNVGLNPSTSDTVKVWGAGSFRCTRQALWMKLITATHKSTLG